MKSSLFIAMLFAVISCAHSQQTKYQKYIGTYKTGNESGCLIELIITANNEGMHYKIKTSKKEREGRVRVSEEEGETYLTFSGLAGTGDDDGVESQYTDSTIIIQNEGNAMNEFELFEECGLKFIELKKTK
jgi:hypothetical protein